MQAALGSSILAAASWHFPSVFAGQSTSNGYGLWTKDQAEVEKLALRLLVDANVRKSICEVRQMYRDDPSAKQAEKASNPSDAADEAVGLAALYVASSDTTNPRIVWIETPFREWHGHNLPGSRAGVDNPDSIYRMIQIDGELSYRIRGMVQPARPSYFGFERWPSPPGMQPTTRSLGSLRDDQLQINQDGSFEILVGPKPIAGFQNYLVTSREVGAIFIRDTLSDWGSQKPTKLSIEALGESKNAPKRYEQMASDLVSLLPNLARFFLVAKDDIFAEAEQPSRVYNNLYGNRVNNLRPTVVIREGGWAYATGAKFALSDDQALIFTLDPSNAKYLGIQLADVWSRSLEPAFMTSRNNSEVKKNPDGSITYAVCAQDPGLANWLDTRGLKFGALLARWQGISSAAIDQPALVLNCKLASLAEVVAVAGSAVPRSDSKERASELQRRKAAYALRLT